jgi:hypothetical protein
MSGKLQLALVGDKYTDTVSQKTLREEITWET